MTSIYELKVNAVSQAMEEVRVVTLAVAAMMAVAGDLCRLGSLLTRS